MFAFPDENHTILVSIDTTITQCTTIKLLGIYIQADLKWYALISSTVKVKKANSHLFMLRQLKHNLMPCDDQVIIIKSFVQPTAEYAAPVWPGSITKKTMQ